MSYLIDIMKTRHNIQFFSDKIPNKDLIDDILKKAHLLVPHKNNFWYYRVKVYGPEHKEEKRLIGMASVGGEGKDKFRGGDEEDIKRLGEIYDEWSSKENKKKGYPKIEGCNFNMQVTAPYLLVYTHQKEYLSKKQENSSYFKSGKQKEIFKNQFNKKQNLDCNMVAHIHDEMQLQVKEDIAEYVGQKAVQSIQATKDFFNFRCELDGEYKVGNNWAETH